MLYIVSLHACMYIVSTDGLGMSSNSVHDNDAHDIHNNSGIQSSPSQYNNDSNSHHQQSSAIRKKHAGTTSGNKSSASHANSLAAKHIIAILDTVSMLMSRQIRGTVERSMRYVMSLYHDIVTTYNESGYNITYAVW
jgi:hypothetical protein